MTMTNRPRKTAPAMPPTSVTVDLLWCGWRGGGPGRFPGWMLRPGMGVGRAGCFIALLSSCVSVGGLSGQMETVT